MIAEKRERWEELCKQAVTEQDAERMIKLIEEINRLLFEKRARLKAQSKPK